MPWSGIVKNRCKNGDYYWVKANITPLTRSGRVTEYMSVRTQPSQQEISRANPAVLLFCKNPGMGNGRFVKLAEEGLPAMTYLAQMLEYYFALALNDGEILIAVVIVFRLTQLR